MKNETYEQMKIRLGIYNEYLYLKKTKDGTYVHPDTKRMPKLIIFTATGKALEFIPPYLYTKPEPIIAWKNRLATLKANYMGD